MIDKNYVEKEKIPCCNILGVNIAAIDMNWLLDYTERNLSDLYGEYMCVANVHTTIMAYENEKYKDVQNNAVIAIPDGGPLASVGRKRGYSKMRRTTGPSYMVEILQQSANKGYRHFFYGSTQDTLAKIKRELENRYTGIQIAGMFSPPFRKLSKEEDDNVVSMINNARPDFVWVGLGAPKQELWMALHRGKINGFMIGVGAGFDYLAGKIKRAPKWMQDHNLEWLYRLIQDPKRLFRRYFVTNIKFIIHAVIQGK